MFDMNKYKFYSFERNGVRMVSAVSTYAGKTVRGTAKCDPRDNFDMDSGKRLAAARCSAKVAEKRVIRSAKKLAEARAQMASANKYFEDMAEYYQRSCAELNSANEAINDMLSNM